MQPKSLSASALKVAMGCLSRYEAGHLHVDVDVDEEGNIVAERANDLRNNEAAMLGTSVHGALEMYVKTCIMENKMPRTIEVLLDFFKMSYSMTFGIIEPKSKQYKEGIAMLKAWHKRTDFDTFTVVSCEVKTNFPVLINGIETPFNYIWDRFDRLDQEGEGVYRVVDYKTNIWGYSPDDLRELIQARAYALAAAIQLKGEVCNKVVVEFDMLRHDGPVATVFDRDDNKKTWAIIKAIAQKIGETEVGKAPETLNPECGWCIKKVSCNALKANRMVGGIASLQDVEDIVATRAQMAWQASALNNAVKELDAQILGIMQQNDIYQVEVDGYELNVSSQGRRGVDAERVEAVVGPEIFAQYCHKRMTMGELDELLKSGMLEPDMVKAVEKLIYKNFSAPSIKVKDKKALEV